MSETASEKAAPEGLLKRRRPATLDVSTQKTLRLRWKGPYLVLLTTLLSTFMGPLLIASKLEIWSTLDVTVQKTLRLSGKALFLYS